MSLLYFFVQDFLGAFEGLFALSREVFAPAILVEVQHLHCLAGAFGRNALLRKTGCDGLGAFLEETRARLGGVGLTFADQRFEGGVALGLPDFVEPAFFAPDFFTADFFGVDFFAAFFVAIGIASVPYCDALGGFAVWLQEKC